MADERFYSRRANNIAKRKIMWYQEIMLRWREDKLNIINNYETRDVFNHDFPNNKKEKIKLTI